MMRRADVCRSVVSLVAGLAVLSPLVAQTASDTSREPQSPFVLAAERALPTVVNISMERTVTAAGRQPQGPLEEMFREFFRGMPAPPGLPFDGPTNALGSGVIISAEGHVVTNNHVVSGFDRIVVRLADGTEFRGDDVRIVGTDPQTDLAVLKVNSSRPLPAIDYAATDAVRVGDWAIAIGNPFGLQSTLTVGVISATGRSGIPLPEGPSRQDFIQTDASVNPGNSGGALVNTRGELVGINTAIRSPVGASVGIGFAVPARIVRQVAGQLIADGRVVRGYLGIKPQAVSAAIRAALKLPDTSGVLVSQVLSGTPAEAAGLEAGDVIVEVEGIRTAGVAQFREQIAAMAPGARVSLVAVRAGRRATRTATLVEFPAELAAAPTDSAPWLGLRVRALTPDERRQRGGDAGVIVEEVVRGSPAAAAGVEAGDVVLKVGDVQIGGLRDYRRAEAGLSDARGAVLFYLRRDGDALFVAVEPAE